MEFGVFDHVDRSDVPLRDYYEQRLGFVESYDRLGFDFYHVAEHHATPLGMATSPSVYLAAVAQRTKRIKFGPLVYLLPFYHPLRLIEEICILDQISLGRMQIGIGRGISPFETRYYGLDPERTREQYEECTEVLLKGLTQKVLSHHGAHYRFDNVPMVLEPFQKPHPPLWMGVQSAGSAEVAARRGINTVSLLPPKDTRAVTDAYRRNQVPGKKARTGLSFFIAVADDAAAAQREATSAYARWHTSFNYLYKLHGRGPMLGPQPADFAEVERLGRGIAATPDRVAAFLREAVADAGINYVVCQFVFGTMSAEFAQRSIALFAREVMPVVKTAHAMTT